MKNIRIILSVGLAMASLTSFAKPARQGVLKIQQPDGSTIEARIHGDERNHFMTTPDGYLLTEDAKGFIHEVRSQAGDRVYIADPAVQLQQMSAAKATRNIAKNPGLFPSYNFPVTGSPKALVILVEYKNLSFSTPNAHDYFNRQLNEEGYSDNGATGSVRDYFIENSRGQFTPVFDVVGPVKLSQNYSYYGENDSWGDDKRPGEMVAEACQLIKDQVNFADYDTNGDGYVDNVFVYYAGKGEADGGGANTIWPHQYTLLEAMGSTLELDGVEIDSYGCTNEIDSYTKVADGIGTFVHEFSHVMGLPDLYTTDYSSTAFTPGEWSCLDYGPYNNDGRTPPNYASFERYALGWMQPTPLHKGYASLQNLNDCNEAFILENPSNPNEYFLFENRQQTGNDYYIPGHGMLIWHIDYVPRYWSANTVNNSKSHQYVDIIEADGSQNENNRNGDCFPGKRGVTEFTPTTTPAFKFWKAASGAAITDIKEVGGIISFITEFEDEGTGIDTPAVEIDDDAVLYDLNGREIHGNPAPGMYIVKSKVKSQESKVIVTK